jgi:hypothetical protein
LRLIVGERLAICQRRHLGGWMRDAGQEVSLYREALPQATLAALASMLLGRLTSPSHAAVRAELMLQVQEALNALDPLDREVVALRHFEQLSRAETAQVLGITEEAGAKRYTSAPSSGSRRCWRRCRAAWRGSEPWRSATPRGMTGSIGSPRSSPTATAAASDPP